MCNMQLKFYIHIYVITSPENAFCKINLGILKAFDNLRKCANVKRKCVKKIFQDGGTCDSTDLLMQICATFKFIKLIPRLARRFHTKCYESL